MKEDALNLIATYTAIAEAATWLMTCAAAIVYGFATWVVVALGRLAFDQIGGAFTRANQLIADIQQPRKEKP